MSVALRLRSKLPDGDLNGLALLGAEVSKNAGTRILIALVSPVSVTENLETGGEVLALGLEHVELVDTVEARELLARIYSDRTGIERLPFGETAGADLVDHFAAELVDAAKAAGLNVTTGELDPAAARKPRKRGAR